MKIRLHIGVAATFTALTATMLGLVVWFLYVSNRELALTTADSEMVKARQRSVEEISRIISDTGRVTETVASLVAANPDTVQSPQVLEVLRTLIEGNDQYYGVYFGLQDGAFYQVVNLSGDLAVFGPEDAAIPPGTRHVFRVLDGVEEARMDELFWQSVPGQMTRFSQVRPTFDPRTRPWYEGAVAQGGIFVSPIYIFQSTGRPGVTFSRQILDAEGQVIGVAGVDMTMANLARVLNSIRIGEEGLVFMIGEEGELLSYTGTRSSGDRVRFLSEDGADRPDNPIVARAVEIWHGEPKPFFHFMAGPEGRAYVGSVARIPELFGVQPTLGFAVPEEEFIGAINRTTRRILQISALVLVLAVSATLIIARLMSRDLRKVTEEANKIRNFDLGENLQLSSRIEEVSELSAAMESMKAGLNSFGAYVPKELVRNIISTGRAVQIEGEAREVSVLFSDLQGFTARTETMDPSDLMPALSEYFEAMEHEISAHKGTVDKYIGDAIMALWNAPLTDADHATHACRAALACLQREAALNARPQGSPLQPLHTRFGLHCGETVVGNVGSLSRMQYTALGAAVNLASRVEGLNKAYGTRILATQPVVHRAADSLIFRQVDLVSPAGAREPTALFELVGEAGTATGPDAVLSEELAQWQSCLALYQASDWSRALEQFQAHHSKASNPFLVQVYIDRCEQFVNAPPPPDWDGIFRYQSK
ncbi:MAG: HAMP domain-containing protein [Rhodobacteraceae bacterium]|nr:HAMP domain-containing protein [Paracoccaceae bacterium]